MSNASCSATAESEAPTDVITRLQSTVRSQAVELRRARIEATASTARLEALGALIKQQQQLASDLQRRLMGAKLPQPALAMPDPPKPADVASTASAHLDAAQASLAQCVLSLAAGGTSDSPASVSKRLPPPPSDADASDSEGVDEVDDLSIRLVAALRACSSLKQMVPLAEAAAVQRCDEQRARHQAASERVSRSEAEARRLLTETHQLRTSVRLLREQLKAAAHSHATELTVVHSEMRQLRLALSTAMRRPKPNGLATPATSVRGVGGVVGVVGLLFFFVRVVGVVGDGVFVGGCGVVFVVFFLGAGGVVGVVVGTGVGVADHQVGQQALRKRVVILQLSLNE